jgi:hypothetical protein
MTADMVEGDMTRCTMRAEVATARQCDGSVERGRFSGRRD